MNFWLVLVIFVKLYEVKNMATPDENTSPEERFCWLMKHLPQMDQEPTPEIVGNCGAMVKAARIAGFNKNKKLNYVKNMDKEHLERAIRNQNRREGIEEGLKKGLKQGLKKGREEGREEGRAEANRENARKLLALGVDINIIVQTTGLTPEEIQTL